MEWRSPTLGLDDPDLNSRLGLRFSRLRRFYMTALRPCLYSHASFTIATCLARRFIRLEAYRLFTLALRRLKTSLPP